MASSVGLLEFFILEASDYVEQLDGLIARAGPGGPEAAEFTRYAKMLRGSATMARQGVLAEVAGAVERTGRALHDGTLLWEPGLQNVLTGTIDDLKIMVRGIRSWGARETQLAQARIAELARYAPPGTRPFTPTPGGMSGTAYLIGTSSEIAAALQRFAAQPHDRSALETALAQVRALRGIAAIKDLPPLPEVVEAVERAAKPLELGVQTAGQSELALFSAAAAVLQRAAEALQSGARPPTSGRELQRFLAAAAQTTPGQPQADAIVPIHELFFNDGGPDVVTAAPNPPTTPAERFRLEIVSQAEHLRLLVMEAQQARDAASQGRLTRELDGALRALGAAADSFGQHEIAALIGGARQSVSSLDPAALAGLDDVALLLSDPRSEPDQVIRRLKTLSSVRAMAGRAGGGRVRTPTGNELHSMLQHGIAALDALPARPLSNPVPLVDPTLVPIEALLYRGRAALTRALELRDQLRRHPGAPPQAMLDELYDLLELAHTE